MAAGADEPSAAGEELSALREIRSGDTSAGVSAAADCPGVSADGGWPVASGSSLATESASSTAGLPFAAAAVAVAAGEASAPLDGLGFRFAVAGLAFAARGLVLTA